MNGDLMESARVIENVNEYELGHFKIVMERIEAGEVQSEILEMPAFSYGAAAAKETMDHLRNFENPKEDLNLHGGLQCALTFVHWAFAVECLMASVVYVYNKYKKSNLLNINDESNIHQMCRAIICAVNSDRLQDLNSFLNEDFHNFWKIRNFIVHTKIKKYDLRNCQSEGKKHAFFHQNPFFMTITDVIEVTKIAIQVFNIYRDVIKYLDLMPSVPLVGDDAIAFVKLDSWYDNVLLPAYCRMLKKHGLATNRNLGLKWFDPIGVLQMDYISCKPIMHAKRMEDNCALNGDKTQYLQHAVLNEIQRLGVKKGMIRLPNQIGRNV